MILTLVSSTKKFFGGSYYRLKLSKRYFRISKPSKAEVNSESYKCRIEFDSYQRANYSKIPVACLCGGDSSYLISTRDRNGVEFPLVICRLCGLIRAKEYWDQEFTIDFYKNWYRKIGGRNLENNPSSIYHDQIKKGEKVYNFTKDFTKHFKKRYTVVDIGGATGGVLHLYLREANCYLFDYNKCFIQFSREQGIRAAEGGISEVVNLILKPNLVILSHVIEHFTQINKEIEMLQSVLEVGSLVYIGLPGIDSLKNGRRGYDFLGDIHQAHVFYFSTETLNNLMGRHGFRCLKIDTEINALYEYTGVNEKLINNHDVVVSHIRASELKRKLRLTSLRRIVSLFLPYYIKDFIKKFTS